MHLWTLRQRFNIDASCAIFDQPSGRTYVQCEAGIQMCALVVSKLVDCPRKSGYRLYNKGVRAAFMIDLAGFRVTAFYCRKDRCYGEVADSRTRH